MNVHKIGIVGEGISALWRAYVGYCGVKAARDVYVMVKLMHLFVIKH
jgi:hypothetical protein